MSRSPLLLSANTEVCDFVYGLLYICSSHHSVLSRAYSSGIARPVPAGSVAELTAMCDVKKAGVS